MAKVNQLAQDEAKAEFDKAYAAHRREYPSASDQMSEACFYDEWVEEKRRKTGIIFTQKWDKWG